MALIPAARAGRVAYHPGSGGLAAVMREEVAVGSGVLFRQYFDGGEEVAQTGALNFVGLLVDIAFGDEDQAVPPGKLAEGRFNAGEELDFGGGDGLGEGDDAGVVLVAEFGGGGRIAELLETGDERAAKTLEAVAVLGDGGALAEVEVLADLFAGVNAMVKVGDERGDGALEVDVVLPERIVGVKQKGLAPQGLASEAGQYDGGSNRIHGFDCIGRSCAWLAMIRSALCRCRSRSRAADLTKSGPGLSC
jgi:hypothetical protein